MPTSETHFKRYLLLGLCVATVFLAGGVIAGSADSHVTLTVDDSTSVPSETVEFEGESYDINSVTVRDQGTDFTAQATLPDENFSEISFNLYEADSGIIEEKRVFDPEKTEKVTFEASRIAPGSYMLGVVLKGSIEQIQPVVITGYDITVDHAGDPSREENLDISAEVTPTELSSAPAGVEVVVWNESHSQTFEMDHSDDETYTTNIELDQFETGEYTVNVAALGSETFRGQQEVLALESSSLTIQETTSSDGTDSSDAGGDNRSNSDDSTTDETGDKDDSTSNDGGSSGTDDTSTESDNSSSDDDSSTETDNTTDGDADDSETGSDGSTTSDTDETDDDVISPNQDSSNEDTDDQVSLFAVQGVFLLLIVVVSIRRIRN